MTGHAAFAVIGTAAPATPAHHAALWLALFLLALGAVRGFLAMRGRLVQALAWGPVSVACAAGAWAVWDVLHA